MAQKPNWVRASSLSRIYNRSRLDTPHSVGLLWTSDQPDAETFNRQQTLPSERHRWSWQYSNP